MASAKDLKKKITSISNTSKITRTMEMVSAAKAKQTMKRVEANTPYAETFTELLEGLLDGGGVQHDLLTEPETHTRNALLVVSANRGLCGGYNTNILVRMEKWVAAQREQGIETDISMIGKKGIARCRFRKIDLVEKMTHIEDRPSFKEAEEIAQRLTSRFLGGEVGRVYVLSTRYHSAANQRSALTQLLPLQAPTSAGAGSDAGGSAKGGAGTGADFIFEPSPEEILEKLLPFYVSQLVYRLLVEAAASEQIARRVAMKLATDNASELITKYRRKYNRQRQASITQQIMEIVGGAEALD